MERVHRVRTPEMVEFTFPVAGLASRFLAWAIDAALIVGVVIGAGFVLTIVGAFAGAANPNLGFGILAIWFVVTFIVTWGYFVFFESVYDGRTPGKRALGLRTISTTGVRLTLAQAGIRNICRVIDCQPGLGHFAGPYLVGSIVHGLAPGGQRLGDLLAGTIVVREEKREVPKRIGFPEAKYNSFLEDPALAARIARQIRAEEREVLLEILLRRDELELATRTELFQKLAKHFADKLGLTDGTAPNAKFLSDEKIVMNLAQTIVEGERKRLVMSAPMNGSGGNNPTSSARVPVAGA